MTMKNWLSNLFPPHGEKISTAGEAPEGEILPLQREVQTLRIELDAREQSIANLKSEVERLRSRQEQLVGETVATKLTGLFSDLAGPASQILTQADLLENQGKPVQARDVLSVARRLVRAIERHGVVFEGKIGEQAAFDPNRHTPISSSSAPQAGQPVTIRFAGVSYQGKIIYKAIVE